MLSPDLSYARNLTPIPCSGVRRSDTLEVLEITLGREPEVRWSTWLELKKIPEMAQHIPHARTPPKAVNKEAGWAGSSL